jgi:hypothetical protein
VHPLGHGHTHDLVREPLKLINLAGRQSSIDSDFAVIP